MPVNLNHPRFLSFQFFSLVNGLVNISQIGLVAVNGLPLALTQFRNRLEGLERLPADHVVEEGLVDRPL